MARAGPVELAPGALDLEEDPGPGVLRPGVVHPQERLSPQEGEGPEVLPPRELPLARPEEGARLRDPLPPLPVVGREVDPPVDQDPAVQPGIDLEQVAWDPQRLPKPHEEVGEVSRGPLRVPPEVAIEVIEPDLLPRLFRPQGEMDEEGEVLRPQPLPQVPPVPVDDRLAQEVEVINGRLFAE